MKKGKRTGSWYRDFLKIYKVLNQFGFAGNEVSAYGRRKIIALKKFQQSATGYFLGYKKIIAQGDHYTIEQVRNYTGSQRESGPDQTRIC